ncbi:MAG: hypothetical protein M1820_001433 [Bogoriella megaspora]|nr:MAG: hypothetical protein M1820_001433 [Bogoriella megaspora]
MSFQLSPLKSGSHPTIQTTTIKTKTTGPYSRNFEQELIDNCIYPHRYRYPDGRNQPKPANLEDIQERLQKRQASLSSSQFGEEDFDRCSQADADAKKEDQVRESVILKIAGEAKDSKTVSGGVPFGNLKSMVEAEDFTVPQTDYYYGAWPKQLKRPIRQI